MVTLLLFTVSLAAVVAAVVALASFAWRAKPASTAAKAAYIGEVSSQTFHLGMESALPYLSSMYSDSKAASTKV